MVSRAAERAGMNAPRTAMTSPENASAATRAALQTSIMYAGGMIYATWVMADITRRWASRPGSALWTAAR